MPGIERVGCQAAGFVAGVGGGDQELVLDMSKLNCLLDNGEKMLRSWV